MSFISYLFNGLSLGSVYAIIALGYTMVYGIAKMLNFAHGDVIMIGAYVSLLSMTNAGIPAFPALIISIVVCTVLGIVIERIAYKPLRNASSSLAVLITAIGVSYLLQNVALLLFGANAQTFPSIIKWEGLSLAGGKLNLSGETIITIIVCIIIMIALMFFVQKQLHTILQFLSMLSLLLAFSPSLHLPWQMSEFHKVQVIHLLHETEYQLD